jgi:hypothetical protein
MKIVECAISFNDPKPDAVRLVIADSDDPDARTESITVQLSIDVPLGQRVATLQARVLDRVREILDPLNTEMRKSSGQAQSTP